MLKDRSEKKNLIINSLIDLQEDDGKGKGRYFVSRFIEPGLAHYKELGDIVITKETLDKFIQSMVGCPVIIDHKDVTDKNVDKLRVGTISRVWFNEQDGWYYCEGILTDDEAIDLVKNQGWNVSCSYSFVSDDTQKTYHGKPIDMEFTDGEFLHLAIVEDPRYEGANIVINSNPDQKRDRQGRWTQETGNEYFDNNEKSKIVEMKPDEYIEECSKEMGLSKEEIIKSRTNENLEKIKEKFNAGEKMNIPYLHYQDKDFNQDGLHRTLAVKELGDETLPVLILDERTKKADNSTDKENIIMQVLDDLKNFILGVVNNEKEDEMKVENEDKRKLIDEIGGILKDKVDDEIIRTVIKKAEELSYEPSEDDKADNKCKNEEDEDKKEETENKCKNEKEEEVEEKVEEKEEEKDVTKNEEDKKEEKEVKNSMKDLVMGGNGKVEEEKLYISRKERLEEGNKF